MRDVISFVLSTYLSYFGFSLLDKRYSITCKLSYHIKISNRWKGFMVGLVLLIAITIIALIGLYLLKLSELEYNILSGVLTGIIVDIEYELNKNRRRIRM